MKILQIAFFFLLLSNSIKAQTQFNIFSGVNFPKLEASELFDNSRGLGLNVGIASSKILSEKTDLIGELEYSYKFIDTKESKELEGHNINVSLLYNYVFFPGDNGFYFSAHAGLGTTFLNQWEYESSDFSIDGDGSFIPFWVVGTSLGIGSFRVTFRYNKSLTDSIIAFNNISDDMITSPINYFSVNLSYVYDIQF